jgi:hypothetical protein
MDQNTVLRILFQTPKRHLQLTVPRQILHHENKWQKVKYDGMPGTGVATMRLTDAAGKNKTFPKGDKLQPTHSSWKNRNGKP